MATRTNQYYKFRGGTRIGILTNTWPNGILEVSSDCLILRDELIGKELRFSKDDVSRIEVKKLFPIIGHVIQIHHNNKSYDNSISFGCFHMKKLANALKELGWMA